MNWRIITIKQLLTVIVFVLFGLAWLGMGYMIKTGVTWGEEDWNFFETTEAVLELGKEKNVR